MMGPIANFFVLADAVSAIQRFVDVFFIVYTLAILIYILLSWFQLPYSGPLATAQRFLHDVCAPYLGLFRRFIPPLGPLDISPIVAIVLLGVVRTLVREGLGQLH
jgi:uncharacterized protein YggT (Ycf19 family)